jgi:Ulp1 family protease
LHRDKEKRGQADFAHVKRWIKKAQLDTCDVIIIPLYIPGHWLTAAANLVDKQLFIYDSYCTVDGRIKLSAAHVKAKTDLFYYIKALLQHHKHQFNAKAWTVQSIEMTP